MRPKHPKLLVSLVIGGFTALIALNVYLSTCTATEITEIVIEFTRCLCCIGMALIAMLPFAGIAALTFTFLNMQAVRTCIRLAAHRISAKIAARNAHIIYPYLQQFLFFVLSQNREFLNLPLGKDASCLLPCGYAPAYRSGCVFYRFQLVVPDEPEMELPILRLVVQNYITTELMAYGIPGLPASFQSAAIGILPSVFLDRLYYDEGRHYMSFDVLFVDNEEAAQYVGKAIQYNAAPKQPQAEVFDDDIV